MISGYNTKWKFNAIKYCTILCLLFSACSYKQYHLDKNTDGEPVVKEGLYTFNKPMAAADFVLLDTGALYLQVFDLATSNRDERANPAILKFNDDGYFKISSRKFDKARTKESIYYGGKFYLDGNNILIEKFYPAHGGKTNYYVKKISKGSIRNDTLKLLVYGVEHRYVKKAL